MDSARELHPDMSFTAHDASRNPLPGAPADLIYARLLLAHLSDPVVVVQGWLSQLRPGGSLLVEDLEDVIDPPGPLREYEQVSADMVRSSGGVMYAGAVLADLGGHTRRVTVSGAAAARIYLFNVRRWRQRSSPPAADGFLSDLERGLTEVEVDDRGTSVSWIVRQLAITA